MINVASKKDISGEMELKKETECKTRNRRKQDEQSMELKTAVTQDGQPMEVKSVKSGWVGG